MIEISVIIAFAMSITPYISVRLKVPKKLRSWTTLSIIVLLNILNSLVFGDIEIIEAIQIGLEKGIIAVGIYSTGKNTMQFVNIRKNGNGNGNNSFQEDSDDISN